MRQRGRRPSRMRVALRRIVAFVVLAGFLGVGGWLTAEAVRGDDAPAPKAAKIRVAAPRPRPLRIIFPEGFTRSQMAQRIRAVNVIARRKRKVTPRLSPRRYLTATARHSYPSRFGGAGNERSLEGFLFPATYDFTRRTTSRQLVARQLEAFQRNWRKINTRYARSRNLSNYDLLIIASMIEREVRVPRERRLVSAVIYNRLRDRIPLGIDATLRYGLNIPPTRAIRQSELDNSTLYNTRIHAGLPPGPIGNPGLASLQAAARPARVDFLYFVRNRDCRTHFFTADDDEFYARVAAPRC